MKTLTDKNLVSKGGHPIRFHLTEEGKKKAEFIYVNSNLKTRGNTETKKKTSAKINTPVTQIPSKRKITENHPQERKKKKKKTISVNFCSFCGTKLVKEAKFCFQCGASIQCFFKEDDVTFGILDSNLVSTSNNKFSSSDIEVVLLLDMREGIHKDKNYFFRRIKESGINCEKRSLSLGDMLWIGRNKNGDEFIFNFIVERKTLTDLADSINGKRYLEQKFRLKYKSPISNVIYLVEGDFNSCRYSGRVRGLRKTALEIALINTQVYIILLLFFLKIFLLDPRQFFCCSNKTSRGNYKIFSKFFKIIGFRI
jgi:crossover junction endonuclease MUS81